MKKVIFKFYGANFLISIALFFMYRVVLIRKEATTTNGDWLEQILALILAILDALVNIHFAAIYLAVMICSSLTFFLNLNSNIRNNYLLSLLTFIGTPFVCILVLIANVWIDTYSYSKSPLTTLTVFSAIYLFVTTIEFFIFRKKVEKYE